MNIEQWLGENNQIGIDIWHRKYQRHNESFDEWVSRVSGGNEDIAELIESKKFLFGGRILSNRGINDSEEKTTLSNCYVIAPPEDNIESIYETCGKLARTYSYGGGCGIDISKLSPSGAKVHNQAKNTSGAVSFMDSFSQVTEQIGQNGRRGALMISMDCTHPDLEKFITVKSNLDKVTAANISVKVTDKFMQAVKKNKDWELTFTRPETEETISRVVKAKDIYHLLCQNNWDYAEPGILFWDTISEKNLLNTNTEFSYAGTNPCAEEPLPAGGSCLLGSMNLSAFVENKIFNVEEFAKAVKIAVIGLNEVLEEGLSKHPLQEQRESVSNWRQIGLGIFGLADMLIECGLTYGSKESVKLCDHIGDIMAKAALEASSSIAAQKGSYTKFNCEEVLQSNFFRKHATPELVEMVRTNGLRNSQVLTIAPTGTLSTMLNISGGIEPIFANSYIRTTKSLHGKDVDYKVYTPIVQRYMKANNIAEEKDLPEFFVTSADISIDNRIAMQAIWQSHIDASISSTVNLPESATVEDVENLYMQAWEQGLKGITIFRSGCKRVAILNTKPSEKAVSKNITNKEEPDLPWGTVVKVNSDLVGIKQKMRNGCGNFHLQLFFDDATGRPWETFINLGDGGGCERNLEFISKLMSKCLRAGVPIEDLIQTAKSVRPCLSYCTRASKYHDTSKGTSCPNSIGFALEEAMAKIGKMINETPNEPKTEKVEESDIPTEVCPECGAKLEHVNGCITCFSCGWSKCN